MKLRTIFGNNFGLLDNQIFTVQHPCMNTFQNVYYYEDHFPKEIFALIEVKSNVFSVPLKKKNNVQRLLILTVSEREVLIYSSKSYLFARGKRPLK